MTQASDGAIESFLVGAALMGALLLCVFPVNDFDTFWHLANGRAMVEQHTIVNKEIFSYTRPDAEFRNHQWLAQVMLYETYAKLGPNGLIAFKLLIAAGVIGLLFMAARTQGADALTSASLVLLVFLAGYKRYTERPQLFSFLLLALLALLLNAHRAGRLRPLALYVTVPVTMVLWDITHGAVFGVIYLGAFAAGELVRRFFVPYGREARKDTFKPLMITLLITAACMLASPYGPRSYEMFMAYTTAAPEVIANQEFMPTTLAEFGVFWFLLGLTAALNILFHKKLDIAQALVLAAFAVLGVRYNRAASVFALAALPALAYYLAMVPEILTSATERRWLKGYYALLIAGALACVVLVKLPAPGYAFGFGGGIYEGSFTRGAVDFIKRTDLKGNMYNPGHIGGYLAYEMPQRRIFQYNHTNVFGDLYRESLSPDFLDKYAIAYAIIPHFPPGYSEEFIKPGPQWVMRYDDAEAMVLERRMPPR